MKIISSYIWQNSGKEAREGTQHASVLLIQIERNYTPILFGCICDSGTSLKEGGMISGYVTEQLQKWFYQKCHQYGVGQKQLENELQRQLYTIGLEVNAFCSKKNCKLHISLVGILMVGHQFWWIQKGDCKGYLLNQRFLRAHISEIEATEEYVTRGYMQNGIGILLCTEGFKHGITEEMIKECLLPPDITEEIQISKRLNELSLVRIQSDTKYKRNASGIYIKVL